MSSYLIREQHFFCLATRNAKIMFVQLGVKNGIFHPLSGKDKKLDGINFMRRHFSVEYIDSTAGMCCESRMY
jgi:hypothetical protein